MKTSEERVMTVFSCDSRNLRSRRSATSSVTNFSGGPERRYAPLSLPPCPASTTTVLKVLVVFLTFAVRMLAHAGSSARNATITIRFTRRGILILIVKNTRSTKEFLPSSNQTVGLQQAFISFSHLHIKSLVFWAGALKARSEEHTSELQSQSNLVCRLL